MAEDHRELRLRELTKGLPLEVRPTGYGGDGVFASSAIEADFVIFSDVPSCWLPEPAMTHPSANCTSCGAFLGKPGELLELLAGGDPAQALDVPEPDDGPPAPRLVAGATTCGADCPRRPPAWPARPTGRIPVPKNIVVGSGEEEVQLASQLMARLGAAAAAGDAQWRLELDALASPPWLEVATDGDHPRLPEASLAALRASLAADGVGAAFDAVRESELLGLWSRALGAVGRNGIWVQIPSPVVFAIAAIDEGAAAGDASCRTRIPALAAVVERCQAAVAARGGGATGRKRAREDEEEEEEEEGEGESESEGEGGDEEEEEEEEEEEDSDDSEEGGDEEVIQFRWEVAAGGGAPARTLDFDSTLFGAHKGVGVFPLLSKLNHACEPNCMPLWRRDNCVQLVATRALPPGTELTIDYLGDMVPRDAARRRRAWLQEQYGFVCSCVRCVASDT